MSHDRGCPCGREPYEYNDCENRKCTRKDMEEDTVRLEGMSYSKSTGRVNSDWFCPNHFVSIPNKISEYFPRAHSMMRNYCTDEYDGIRVRVVSNKTNRVVDIIQ